MNPLQAINSAASFVIFSALISGLIRMFDVDDDIHLSNLSSKIDSLLFAVFIILFRLKMHFDDHRYFAEKDHDANYFKYVGVMLAVFIWITMAVSAGTIARPRVSAGFLEVALGISTVWLLIHLVEIMPQRKRDPKFLVNARIYWLAFNAVYLVALTAYIVAGSFRTGLLAENGSLVCRALFVSMIIIVVFEKVVGRAYKGFLG